VVRRRDLCQGQRRVRHVYRTVDQYGRVIDVLVAARRDADAARRFFRRALSALKVTPGEVVTAAAV
jgi:transposase-like protein